MSPENPLETGNPPEKAVETVRPEQAPSPERDLANGKSQAISHVPPTPPDAPKTEQQCNDNTPPWKKKMEIAAVFIALGLLLVNIIQMYYNENNGGHIPSGAVEVAIHEATFNTKKADATPVEVSTAIEKHWGRYPFKSIPPQWPIFHGHSSTTNVRGPSQYWVSDVIIIAGFINYNDGFPNTPQQQWPFCQRTTYQTVMKRMLVGPCNPGEDVLHKLELIDGYPNNPEP